MKLNIPSFTWSKRQLSKVEVAYSRRIASIRIQVERVIGKMKKKIFRILKSSFPLVFHKMHDPTVVICAALCNLQPSIAKGS